MPADSPGAVNRLLQAPSKARAAATLRFASHPLHEHPAIDVGKERPSKKPKALSHHSCSRCVIDGTEYSHEDAPNPTFCSNDELEGMESCGEGLMVGPANVPVF